MALYFFDIHDGVLQPDEVGQECENHAEATRVAKGTLSDLARSEILRSGDRQASTVIVRNDTGQAVYSATLTFTGLCLDR